MLKLHPKSFPFNFSAQNSLKLILSYQKCRKNPLLAYNDLFPHYGSWKCVAAVDVLIKKIATISMDYLVNFPTWSFQDVTGVNRDILVILEGPRKQVWGCGVRGCRRRQYRVYGTHQMFYMICEKAHRRGKLKKKKNGHRSQTQKFQCAWQWLSNRTLVSRYQLFKRCPV